MALEKKIQHRVIGYAGKHGFLTMKLNVGGQRGWPDYLLIDPDGWHVYIEFKAPGKQPSKLQIYRMEQLVSRGIMVLVCDDEQQGIKYIDDLVAARVPEESDAPPIITGERGIIS